MQITKETKQKAIDFLAGVIDGQTATAQQMEAARLILSMETALESFTFGAGTEADNARPVEPYRRWVRERITLLRSAIDSTRGDKICYDEQLIAWESEIQQLESLIRPV